MSEFFADISEKLGKGCGCPLPVSGEKRRLVMSVNTFGIDESAVSGVVITPVSAASGCGSCVDEMSDEWLIGQAVRLADSELLVNGGRGELQVCWQSAEQRDFGEFLFLRYGLSELVAMPEREFAAVERVFSAGSAVGVRHFSVSGSGGRVFCMCAAVVVFQFLSAVRESVSRVGIV